MACGVLLALSILKFAYHPFQWVALGAVAIGLPPVISRSISGIQNLRFDINMIVLIAVGGTIALRDYLEAGSIVFLFTVAQWLESRASHKATAAMSSLMSIAPQKATIAETGEEVDVNKVEVDSILAVKAGEAIPIDGIIIEGNCEVDEKMLTGEAFPVAKQSESTVWAGTINLNGYVTVKTTALAEDCAVAKMAKLVEEAQNKKSQVQRLIDNCAQYYTPVVVLISVGFAVIPAALRVHNQKHWFHLALVILVSACPCALILSTPVATFCALSTAATTGLIVKGGDYLEILAKIRTVAFDKTGTITRGEFVVTDFQSLCEDVSLDTLIYWVSSVESKSSHPMASVLVEYGWLSSIEPKLENVEEFQNYPGEGIYGKIDGKEIYIGNKKIAQRAGCTTAPSAEIYTKEGKTNGFVYCGANLVGMFSLSDACRTGAAKAIQELKSLGIKATMLTGDSRAAAMHAQDQLGHALDMVHAELLPADKARIIEDLKKDGPIAMVGDGMNDAPALATADIGISMGIAGSALATETGNVILMSNDICKIPEAIWLARKSHRKVIENIIISITTKGAILALAFAGHPLVWAAVLTDVGTCLLVIFNSMLLLQKPPKRRRRFSNLDGEAKIFCDPVNCSPFPSAPSSLNSCRKGQCTDFIDRQAGHVQCAGLQETKYCGHGGCNEVIDHKRFETLSSSTCRQDKCRNSVATQRSSVGNIINAAYPHGHRCCNNTVLQSCRKNKCTDSVAGQCGGACDERVTVADPSIFREDKSNDGITEADSHGHGCCNVIASSSCEKDKCTDSIARQSGSESDDRITVADPEDYECRNTLPYSLGSSSILEQKPFGAPRTSPCTKVESADSICIHGGCGGAEGLDKIKQCDHGCDGPVTHSTEIYSAQKRIGCDLAMSRMSQLKQCCQNTGAKHSTTCSKPAQKMPNVKHWISACCVGKTVETSCHDYLQKGEPCSANNGSVPSCASLHQGITGCNVSSATLTGYVESGSTTVHACKALKKKENIGGCSKSFSRECCRKQCHFGANLSEIIVQ